MKLYRCDFCGRVFGQKTPHKCYGGCFRKHSIAFTEFDDADCEYVKKSEVDVKENFSTKIWQEPHILSELPVSNIEYFVNWEQARVNAAIGAMTAMLASPELMEVVTNPSNVVEKSFESRVAKLSAEYADALISELKRKDDGEEV